MTPFSHMKLGKRHARHDARVPKLAKYQAGLPTAPPSCDYSTKLQTLGMMANDRLGDCTCAAVGHAIQTWTSQTPIGEQTISDADVVALYERFGYNPANPSSDGGAFISDVLTSWLNSPVVGHRIDAFASVETNNLAEVMSAIYLFGGIDIGVSLPASAQGQSVWDVPPGGLSGPGAPGSWGGHSIYVTGYQAGSYLEFITWGMKMRMTWAFFAAYCDEAFAIQSPDWNGAEGFDYNALSQDMAALKNGDGPARLIPLTDRQLWLIGDAVNAKISGADEDSGVVSVDANVLKAYQKDWQELLDYLQVPRVRP